MAITSIGRGLSAYKVSLGLMLAIFGMIRAILINSGQANACTGNLGIQHFQIATGKIAELLGIKKEEVLMCSTGVIGVPIQINPSFGTIYLLN